MNIEQVLSKRGDISKYLIHLTRDTRDGNSAKENLLSILQNEIINARNHHCLFTPVLEKENLDIQKKFYTTCFTETPLDKISYLIDIEGRKKNLSSFGVVFLKERIIKHGGNPCFYTNGKFNKETEKYLWKLFYMSKNNNFEDNFYKLGALTNTFKDNHDFSWEREWRIYGDFEVDYTNIFAIISEDEDIELPESYSSTPIINPQWNIEEILYHLTWKYRIATGWVPF